MKTALALVMSMMLATVAAAQQQPGTPPLQAAPPPFVDWDKVQIKPTNLGNDTYMLEGQGGNITVAVGTDGIIMIDSQFAPLSDKIKTAIKTISPLRRVTGPTQRISPTLDSQAGLTAVGACGQCRSAWARRGRLRRRWRCAGGG